MRTTSPNTESFGQCRYVSSGVFEKPKSYARVKNCRAPSTRRAASSSSVRMTPSASPSSLPIAFCPPSPRVSDRYAASTFAPRASQPSRLVSSSSGCAPIISTRPVVPSALVRSLMTTAPGWAMAVAGVASASSATAAVRRKERTVIRMKRCVIVSGANCGECCTSARPSMMRDGRAGVQPSSDTTCAQRAAEAFLPFDADGAGTGASASAMMRA